MHFKNLLRTTCKRAKPYPQTKTDAKKFSTTPNVRLRAIFNLLTNRQIIHC